MNLTTRNSVFRLQSRVADFGGAKIWTLIFDLPGEKVNKFDARVMEDIADLLPQLKERGEAGEIEALVVVSPKPGIFIAGADIKLIEGAKTAAEAEALAARGQALLNDWEDLPFLKAVAIQGVALGGGCEFSLASDVIVMANDSAARIGLPEIQLGVLPGMGGCVRLAPRVGLAAALEMILGAAPVRADKAYKMGLADALLPKEDFENAAHAWVAKNLKRLRAGEHLGKEPKLGGSGGIMGSLLENTPMGRAVMLSQAKKGVLAKTRGQYPAPLEAIEVLREIGVHCGPKLKGTRRERALKREASAFGKLAETQISKNLIRLFFLMEGVKKANGLASGGATLDASTIRPFESAAVLGAGVMGGGIAQLFAQYSVPTRMKDLNAKALEIGTQAITSIFKKQLKRRKLTPRQYQQKLNLVTPTLDFTGFKSTDLVVEAIVEKMDVKKAVLKDTETHVGLQTVLASNTSSLSISEMQSALARPENFIGMHFFNPVHKMPLIEVIRGARTSDATVVRMFEFCKKIGKTPIVVKDAPGFLVNRLLVPYMNEAAYVMMEGMPPEEIDRALVKFGMPMGPLELVDEVGVDVGEKVLHILHEAFGERMVPTPGVGLVAKSGRLGKKNGKGIYRYEGEGDRKEKKVDAEVFSILGLSLKPGSVSAEECVDRCILPMINEASRCLEEGIVSSPGELDLGMIMGTGFPPFRGGLLRYADTLGPQEIVNRLEKLSARMGARFAPSDAMKRRAASNQAFYG